MTKPRKPSPAAHGANSPERPDRRSDIGAELDFHLSMTIRELVAAGATPAEAEAEARRRFGEPSAYRARCEAIDERRRRRRRLGAMAGGLLQELRLAARRLARSPLFTLVATLTLGLGIGANTTVFTLLDGVVLRPLPYHDPDRLVSIWMEATDGDEADSLSWPDYLDLKARPGALGEVGFWTWWTMNITDAGEAISVPSVKVSADLLDVLGVEPAAGRLFLPREGEPGNEGVAIVSHRLWQAHYGGDPGLLGSSIAIDGTPHLVVGIMPEGFRFPYDGEYGSGFWTPLVLESASEGRRSRWLNAVARLDDGATVEQARAETAGIGARLAAEYPESNSGLTFGLASLHDSVVGGEVETSLWALYGVVAFVLVIACANLASLLLARNESRQREIAVRVALGAGRGRLLGELLAEAGMLAALGGALGLTIAATGIDLFLAWVPADVPRLDEVGFDAGVLGAALLTTIATVLVFGLFPALHAARGDLQRDLKAAAVRGMSPSRHRLRAGLVVTEIALALVLLVGAGLLLRSFGSLIGEEPGFDPERVLTFQISPDGEPEVRYRFLRAVAERLRELPGVLSAGGNTAPPLSGVDWATAYTVPGEPEPAPGAEPRAQLNVVTPGYFRTLAIPVIAGRELEETDDAGRPLVALVNGAFAARHWAGESPLGRAVRIGARSGSGAEAQEAPAFEVVGVVGDSRKLGIDRPPPPELYISYAQSPPHFMSFVARTADEPLLLVDAVRSRVSELDAGVAVQGPTTMARRMGEAVASPRFNALLVGGFACLALVLATLGIYALVAHAAAERTREIGIRIALGAEPGDILHMMLGQGTLLAAVGLTLGLLAALSLSRLLGGLLYEITATDPLTFVGVAILLGAVALIAVWIPARRATRVDPLIALRDG